MLSAEQIERQAWKLYQRDKYLEAAARLREGLKLYPGCLELLGPLVGTLVCASEYGEAARAFREYRDLGGTEPYLLVSGAEALCNSGMKRESLQVLQDLAEEPILDMDDGTRAGHLLSRLAGEETLFEEACRAGLRLAEKVAAHHPTAPEARFSIGFWLAVGGHGTERALPYVAEGVRCVPDRHDFRVFMGNLLYELDRHAEALVEWEKVPVGEVTCKVALERLAGLYSQMGRYSDAAACLARAHSETKD